MSIKKMSLVVTSGLVFFLVINTIINTLSITSKKLKEKVAMTLKYEINPDDTVSSYNYIEIKKEEIVEPVKEVKEEVKQEIPKQPPVVTETETTTENNNTVDDSKTVYVGKMTGYGADCKGCSGLGNLACKTASGTVHSLTNNGQYYSDASYGSVRIVAADLSKFPCGTIVKITNENLGEFNAVVLDTGGSVKKAWANGTVWMDLAFQTERDPLIYSATSQNTTYEVQRWGW